MVELKGYKVNKLEIENRVKPGVQLKLKNQVKYNVNYLNDNKTCIGILEFKIADEEMNPFELKIEMAAEFTFSPDDDKADIHTASFDQMFPFLRQIVHSATSFTGMPGLLIPIMHLNKNTVQIKNSPQSNESSPLN